MVKTIPDCYCDSKKLPDNVGLILQTHFHNNNSRNPQCLISHNHSMLMLIFKARILIKKQGSMHNKTGFSVGYLKENIPGGSMICTIIHVHAVNTYIHRQYLQTDVG